MKIDVSTDAAAQIAAVESTCAELTSWLVNAAYPIWSTRGIDPLRGGFQERLTLTGEPTDDARRARVQPRQIYAFSQAPSFGWTGDAAGAVTQGLSFFLTRYRRADGLFRTLVTPDGTPADDRALLYDQAFALLAFAAASPLLGSSFNLAGEAEQLRHALYEHLKRAGPGFESGLPHGPPLLSNPHMHLLEAALAWVAVSGGNEWSALADELGELAMTHLIDPATGMLHESFDNAWKPSADAAGRLIEPGHQFEWAWLLMRWGRRRAHVRDAACRLMEVAEAHGVHGGVAIYGITNDTSVHDGSARLWAQTERLRSAALAARLYGDAKYWQRTAAAAASLLRYFATDIPGLWYDRLTPAGEFKRETVTAGNLYHIVGAIYELGALVRSRGQSG
jgi:mannose/cellobiose epimerase-like protein (N-acyl-D-glucosamine 2-epimerase family)